MNTIDDVGAGDRALTLVHYWESHEHAHQVLYQPTTIPYMHIISSILEILSNGAEIRSIFFILAGLATNIVTSIPACPGIVIQARSFKRKVEPGETILFTVNVKNTGPAAAAGVSDFFYDRVQ